jgi:glutathione synthase/RimK-type ligase-like ATP-grasp enzyme
VRLHKTIYIHKTNGFASRWPELFAKHGFPCEIIDAYDPDSFHKLAAAEYFFWHLNHEDRTDHYFSIQLLQALNKAGVKLFPNIDTSWHFDDKAAQAYLLDAIQAPAARTWVLTDKQEAIKFIDSAHYPLVFKLKRGAGAQNVRLVPSSIAARALVNKMFGRGFKTFPTLNTLQRGFKRGLATTSRVRDSFWVRARRASNRFLKKFMNNERENGYILFQEFVDKNTHDTRVTIIGDRAFVFNRHNRDNDFRASGSGKIEYLDPARIPMDMVSIAFKVSKSQNFQSMAYDFVRDQKSGEPKILEICYTFKPEAVEACPGYFTSNGSWVEGHFRPEELILIDLLGLKV